jgi:hypothetical protein
VSSTLAAVPGGLRFFADFGGLARATDLADLRAAARGVADRPDEFASWLVELRQDESRVRAIAARSYWHPNGFAKLVLYSSREPEFKVRLHVWPASSGAPRPGEANPHSHRWDFASTCAVGEGLHMVEYAESDRRGTRYDRYRYGADATDKTALLADGSVRLIRLAAPHVHRGQVYSCDTSVVHTVVPIGTALTATLVVQGPQRSPSTVVYRSPGLGDDQPNGVLTVARFLELTGAVLAAYTAEQDTAEQDAGA